MAGYRIVPPRATSMLESLRGLGYSTGAALADIVDNSISAGASSIHIEFSWEGDHSRISLLDNGRGMSDAQLEEAMRLGNRSPLDFRDPEDLGRFGMGLKTASLSQCRRLTVASVGKEGSTSCLRWDLDEMSEDPNAAWVLFEGPSKGSEIFLEPLSASHSGTMVLWERLDRVVSDGYTADDFLKLIDKVEQHLGMIFHRMLNGPHERLRIFLNGRKVRPWDPFMTGHPAKSWQSPVDKRNSGTARVEVQCHVLPHRDRLTREEFDLAGGPEGWVAQEGFYVYRNERMLLAGGWLGLGQGRPWIREESYRLARIRLDIPNSADAEWKIDIRKSTARPPLPLRSWLTKMAGDTREKARAVFVHRGTPGNVRGASEVIQAWRVDRSSSGSRYRIDEEHPVVKAAIDNAGGNLPLLRAMLKIIEETVPIQRIWLDTSENPDVPEMGFSGETSESVGQILKVIYKDMIDRIGIAPERAKKTLMGTEPFQRFPELVNALSEDPD